MKLCSLLLCACLGLLAACKAQSPTGLKGDGVAATSTPEGKNWNDAQISWLGYEAGLTRAKAEQKPVLLVFYTTWCPHCTRYSRVFTDPKLVQAAKDFVMVRLDADQERALSQRFAVDGGYVPRTYFLRPDGELVASVKAKDEGPFQYFYDEADPRSLLSGMGRARSAIGTP